jgi:hypothetical protein
LMNTSAPILYFKTVLTIFLIACKSNFLTLFTSTILQNLLTYQLDDN